MRLHTLAMIAAALFPSTLMAREWTDISGQYHREAEFLRQTDGQVWLEDTRGKQYVIGSDQLSAADRQYVASLGRKVPAPQLAISTLNYRKPAAQAVSRSVAPAPSLPAADLSLMRLTGWHCYSGYCCPTNCCPTPCPTPCPIPCPGPCPPPEDKQKRIMRGWHSTFHLVTRVPNEIGGTGSYKFVQRDGCCHHYLELLKSIQHTTNNDWLCTVVDSTPTLNVTDWWFKSIPNSNEWYWVYYKSTASPAWVYYDIACGKSVE